MKKLPHFLALFKDLWRRRDVEALCAAKCPELSGRIVSIIDRRILRQSPKSPTFLL